MAFWVFLAIVIISNVLAALSGISRRKGGLPGGAARSGSRGPAAPGTSAGGYPRGGGASGPATLAEMIREMMGEHDGGHRAPPADGVPPPAHEHPAEPAVIEIPAHHGGQSDGEYDRGPFYDGEPPPADAAGDGRSHPSSASASSLATDLTRPRAGIIWREVLGPPRALEPWRPPGSRR